MAAALFQNPTVVVSVVSGAVAVISAIIATVKTVQAEKLKANWQLELERIQAARTNRIEALREANEAVEPVTKRVDDAWGQMQRIKEELGKLLSPGRYDIDFACDTLTQLVDEFEKGYEDGGSKVPEPLRVAWHSAKKTSRLTLSMLASSEIAPRTANLPQELYNSLDEARQTLTESQSILSHERGKLQMSKYRELLGMLECDDEKY